MTAKSLVVPWYIHSYVAYTYNGKVGKVGKVVTVSSFTVSTHQWLHLFWTVYKFCLV